MLLHLPFLKITKGAPHIVAALDHDQKIHDECMDLVNQFGEDGIRSLAIALSEPIDSYDPNEKEAIQKSLVWHLQVCEKSFKSS
jgi:hypothetical protein